MSDETAIRANARYGANPYPGRVLLRQLANDYENNEGGPASPAWMEARKDALIDAYVHVVNYVAPERTAEQKQTWAEQRYVQRLAEITLLAERAAAGSAVSRG